MPTAHDFSSEFNERYSLVLRRILNILSEDSRAKISDIADQLHLSRRTISLKLAAIEKELGISYILELNEEKLGLNRPHLILARFDSKPDYARIKELLKQSHVPQLAVSVKGTYDMLIYANALSGREYAQWDKTMQTKLSDYKVEWYASEVVHRQLGFFPLRNAILERINIQDKYKKMLIALNGNARMRFQELAKKLEMNVNTAAYNFNNLMKEDYIRGFTLATQIPKDISLMSFFAKYVPSKGYESASAIARACFTTDDEHPLISRYLITAPLIGSFDFFTLGAFDNSEIAYKKDVLYHKNLFKKYKIKMLYGEVDEVLLGRLPIRSLNTKKEYKTLSWSE